MIVDREKPEQWILFNAGPLDANLVEFRGDPLPFFLAPARTGPNEYLPERANRITKEIFYTVDYKLVSFRSRGGHECNLYVRCDQPLTLFSVMVLRIFDELPPWLRRRRLRVAWLLNLAGLAFDQSVETWAKYHRL